MNRRFRDSPILHRCFRPHPFGGTGPESISLPVKLRLVDHSRHRGLGSRFYIRTIQTPGFKGFLIFTRKAGQNRVCAKRLVHSVASGRWMERGKPLRKDIGSPSARIMQTWSISERRSRIELHNEVTVSEGVFVFNGSHRLCLQG
jgi:hypothetical protein